MSEFDEIIKQTVRTYGIKGPLLAELHSRLVAKHGRLAYEKLAQNDLSPISSVKADKLLGFLDEGKKISDDGVSPELTRIQILCFSGRWSDALNHCEKQVDSSNKNILVVTVALLAAICENAHACTSSLESYSPLPAQYAPDLVNTTYLIARLYTDNLTNDHYQKILLEIETRNPKPSVWLTEQAAIALLKMSSPSDSYSIISEAEKYLLSSGSLTAESIFSFRDKSLDLMSAQLMNDLFVRLNVNG